MSVFFVGCDHAAVELKESLVVQLRDAGHEVFDLGISEGEKADYPDLAHPVCEKVLSHKDAFGLLICGTGIGMSMAANRHRGIRAALCGDVFSATMTRAHNDANVLCLGARVTGVGLASQILSAFCSASFEGGRHQRRIDKINQ